MSNLSGQEELSILCEYFPSEELRIDKNEILAEYALYKQLAIQSYHDKKFSVTFLINMVHFILK